MAGTYNLSIEQGATFEIIFQWTDANNNPINITGYTARSQIRPDVTSSTVVCDMTIANSKLSLYSAVNGQLKMLIGATETATFPSGSAVWDLEMIDGSGKVTRLLQGSVNISPEVTR